MNFAKFRIVIDPAAAKDLKRLHRVHRDISKHIISFIDSLATLPLRGKPLKGNERKQERLL